MNIKGKHGRTALYLAAEGNSVFCVILISGRPYIFIHLLLEYIVISIHFLQEGIIIFIHLLQKAIYFFAGGMIISYTFVAGGQNNIYTFVAGGHIFIVKLLLQHPDIDVNSRY